MNARSARQQLPVRSLVTGLLTFTLGGLLYGCAPSLAWNWAPRTLLTAPAPSAYPDAPAVYRLRERRFLLDHHWQSPSIMQIQHHEVVSILNERGFRYANVGVRYDGDAKIVSFAARTIAPDGTVRSVAPSSVHDEVGRKDSGDSSDSRVRIFAFPEVKVGSTLEYQYTIEYPELDYRLTEFTNDALPIEKYVLEIEGTPDLLSAAKVYNTDRDWTESKTSTGWKLSWTGENIPASKSEEYSTGREQRDPWWVWTVRQISRYQVTVDIDRDWNAALQWTAKDFYYGEKYEAGFKPTVPHGPCQGPVKLCLISDALAWLRKEAPFSRFGGQAESAQKVLTDAKASDKDKARLLHILLKQAGVESKLAVSARYLSASKDYEFPAAIGFDHWLLFLPEQEGVPVAQWVDPSCEYCGVGELPPWSLDQEALVVTGVPAALGGRASAKTERRTITGRPGAEEANAHVARIQVQADGAATMRLQLGSSGFNAQQVWADARHWTEEEQHEEAEKSAKARVPTAKVDHFSPVEIDEGHRRTKRTIDFSAPHFAVVDGAQLVVPLTVLGRAYDRTFAETERRSPIGVALPERIEETLVLEPPPGYVPLPLAPPLVLEAPPVKVVLSAEPRGNAVVVRRELIMNKGLFPVETYPALRKALATFRSAREGAVVFVKQ